VQPCPAFGLQRHIHAGNISGAAAIGAFRRLCCNNHIAGICHAAIIERVAAGDPAGCIDQNNLVRSAVAARQQGLGRSCLIQPCQRIGRKADINGAACAL